MKDSKEYRDVLDKALSEGKLESDIFEAGYDFAMSQPKHIFDGAAKVGEVRRFEDGLVDVVENKPYTCTDCALMTYDINCSFFTGCDINNVKYIKR